MSTQHAVKHKLFRVSVFFFSHWFLLLLLFSERKWNFEGAHNGKRIHKCFTSHLMNGKWRKVFELDITQMNVMENRKKRRDRVMNERKKKWQNQLDGVPKFPSFCFLSIAHSASWPFLFIARHHYCKQNIYFLRLFLFFSSTLFFSPLDCDVSTIQSNLLSFVWFLYTNLVCY